MWSLFVPVYVKSWPKVKWGQVEVDSNIAKKKKSYLLIIYTNSYDNMHDSAN